MYKLLIVDDEKWVRKGLINTIEWSKHDIEIIGEAEDGESALEVIKRNKPDIIISDVYMDKMDGLVLLNKCLELAPDIKFIILSGHEEFELVKDAIANNAVDYILKPAREEKLIKVVDKAKKQIDKNQKNIEYKRKVEKFKENIPVLKEKYLNYLLEDRIDLKEIINNYNFLNINFSDENFLIMIVAVAGINCASKSTKTQIKKIEVKECIEKITNDYNVEILEDYPNRFVIIINFDDHQNDKSLSYIDKIAQEINQSILKNIKLSNKIGIGKLYQKSERISDSYQEAKEALEYKLFLENDIIFFDDIKISNNNYIFSYPEEIEKSIIRSIKAENIEAINKNCKEFIQFFKKSNKSSPQDLKRASLQLTFTILKELVKWDISLGYLFKEQEIELKIKSAKSLRKLNELLNSFAIRAAEEIKDKNENKNQRQIMKAKKYISENYDKDLSLNDIAEEVYLSPNYFSNLFKEQINQTVISYLTEVRISKSKKMLKESNLKIYEIAERVGYNNSRYFSQLFKKKLGVTPNEYRKR